MPSYEHAWYCKRCKVVYKLILDTADVPDSQRCFELAHQTTVNNNPCQNWAKKYPWDIRTYTKEIQKAPVETLGSYAERIIKAQANLSGSSMVAALIHKDTNEIYFGASGKSKAQGSIPGEVWEIIESQPVIRDDWGFGTNCAEVDALRRLYARVPEPTLSDHYSIAAGIRGQSVIVFGACRTCSAWLSTLRIKKFNPAFKTFN